MTRVLGADFARWQGKVAWDKVADAPIKARLPSGNEVEVGILRFASCKATHGTSGVDQAFAHNSVGRKAMWRSGYYFWFVPGLDPRKQAEHFVRTIEATYDSSDLCAAMDFEELFPEGFHGGAPRLLDDGVACGERVEELLGHRIMVYSGDGFWSHPRGCGGLDSEWFASRDYWHAQYLGHVPSEAEVPRLAYPWRRRGSRARIWQFDGDRGLYLPDGTDCDFNFFDGSEDQLQAWIDTSGIIPTPEPGLQLSDDRPPNDPYVVDRLELALDDEDK
jgi:GH25 family lysozyme M1 (1,4-beta-N-acetylmuramidase)